MKKLIIVGIIVTMMTALTGCSTDKKEEIHIESISGGTETIITENIIEENIIEGFECSWIISSGYDISSNEWGGIEAE